MSMVALVCLGSLLLVASAGLVLEVYCRQKWQGVAIRDDLYADPRWRRPFPFIMFKGCPNYDHLNELGYPGPAPAMPKPAGEYRVVMLGGSTVFNGPASLPGLLERRCHEHGMGHVRVYNGGVISSSSGMDLARALFEFVDRKPDLIVFYNGGNDLLGPHSSDPRPGYPPNYLVHEANPILEENIGRYPLLTLILYGSIVLRYRAANYFHRHFVRLGELRDVAGHRSNAWQQALVDTYVNNLVRASHLARGCDAGFAAFFQPLLSFKDPESVAEEERRHAAAPGDTYWANLRRRTQEALARAAHTSGLCAVDLSGLFSSTSRWVYTDAIHIRPEMGEVVVDRMFEELRQRDLLPRPAQPSLRALI